MTCGSFASIESLKLDGQRIRFQIGSLEQCSQLHAGPFRVAHRSIAPLSTRNARLHFAAAIAGTLVNGGYGHGFEFADQFAEGKFHWALHASFNTQTPGR